VRLSLPTLRQWPLVPRQVASADHRRRNSILYRHRRGREHKTRPLSADLTVVAAARGSAQPSALRVIELYQGLVRAFQRCGKGYELRCGLLYARTIAAFADRR
jgi:hypothetical protein